MSGVVSPGGRHRAAAPRVVVIGESLVDIVVHTDGSRTEAPGGSPMNVAVALARLGVPTHLATSLGADEHGDLVRAHLSRSGVTVTPDSHALTTTSTAVAHLRSDGSAVYQFDLTWDPCLPTLGSPAVVHAGSVALWLEPGGEVVRRRLQEAAGAGALITIDPNIRPAVLPAPEVVRERFEELAQTAHVVKMSAEDAAYLYPALSAEGVVERLAQRGVQLVAVTDEHRGTLISSGRSSVTVRPPLVSVSDTIGAGDTYMGALVQQLLTRGLVERVTDGRALSPDELVAICLFANRAAAVTVGRHGADPPWLAELQARAARSTA